ncbi:hypothetical protein ABE82_26080 (plasmid) [Paenibacillus peoriae]|uniref:hypothetical protein n=1 Tax=Paenibacillus peoriae TaxID=59893 RepID=UPI000720D1E6|nr:hypothetical protein [Paenibacillus peoriae]ALS09890.1 hypothetical protein ABE82_26080 [Paenibacillus peoriae]
MNPDNCIMTYTMNSGIKGSVVFTSKQISEWIESYRVGSRYVTTVNRDYFGLNPELVADFKIHNYFSEQRIQLETIPLENPKNDLQADSTYSKAETIMQIECKCGESYIIRSAYKKLKWSCKNCNSIVFLDRKKGLVDTEEGKAWYMTNRYFVDRNALGR